MEMKNSITPYFDRKTTNIIKGIALIMMFVHHFFTFPDWWIEGISYPVIAKFAPYFCAPFRLCVPIFCFLTGYFYFYCKSKTYKYSLKKICDILIEYWFVFFIFAILASVLVKYKYTLVDFIKECFALYRPTMCFCWYVAFYISFMLLIPLVTKIMSKNIHFDLFLSLIMVPVFFWVINHFVQNGEVGVIFGSLQAWFPIVLVGYIFSSHSLFQKMSETHIYIYISRKRVLSTIILVLILLIVPMGRWAEPSVTIGFTHFPSIPISMDVIYTPVFIFALVNLCSVVKLKGVKSVLIQIGKYSLPMWFVSCIFFGNCEAIFQPILYWPHNPVLVTIWGLLICFVVSYVMELAIKPIQNFVRKKLFR